jgi:RNA polymerase sigma-70 factor (ECF subfamily)
MTATQQYAAGMSEVAEAGLDEVLERYRRELTAHCYRMLGSSFEAEDAVQETFIRAWRGMASFEGRSSLRSWLYRIATNVSLDMLGASQRRARPVDLNPAQTADSPLDAGLPENAWIEPVPEGAQPETRAPKAGTEPGIPRRTLARLIDRLERL